MEKLFSWKRKRCEKSQGHIGVIFSVKCLYNYYSYMQQMYELSQCIIELSSVWDCKGHSSFFHILPSGPTQQLCISHTSMLLFLQYSFTNTTLLRGEFNCGTIYIEGHELSVFNDCLICFAHCYLHYCSISILNDLP